MKNKLAIFAILIGLFSSLSADAAYWICTGEKIKALFGQVPVGLILRAENIGSDIPSNLVNSGVNLEDVRFNKTGKSMKDVNEVSAEFSGYKAKLSISVGKFSLTYGNKIIASDKEMDCKYSAGE